MVYQTIQYKSFKGLEKSQFWQCKKSADNAVDGAMQCISVFIGTLHLFSFNDPDKFTQIDRKG